MIFVHNNRNISMKNVDEISNYIFHYFIPLEKEKVIQLYAEWMLAGGGKNALRAGGEGILENNGCSLNFGEINC